MGINNIHRDLTAAPEAPTAKPSVLAGILRNQDNATYFISTPRVGHFTPQTCAKFLTTYEKREGVRPQAERVSKSGDTVQIWVRSYGDYTYMIETITENMV